MTPSKPIDVMQALTAAMNSGPAQRLGDAHYKPRTQGYWSATKNGTWQPVSSTQKTPSSRLGFSSGCKAIRLMSWNIDILVGCAEERMRAALQYLNGLVASTTPETPVVVFLQEMGQSDLQQIRDADWIKARFNITELDHRNWLSPLYGTTVLVDHRLIIKSVFRVPWISKFDRDGLFVDIALASTGKEERVLRLCNTHLESLVADPPVRPTQLADASRYLQDSNVAAALLAGDLNAIQPFDRTLHSNNDLKDTYLELGGQEDSDAGYTWGYQVQQWMRQKFGCSRMDKILLRGTMKPKNFERIGMGVKVAEEVRERVEQEVEGGWVTDHYGVLGDFELTERLEFQVCDEHASL
jgi:tyrosyl-DNA phosphodiesterase 2